MSDTDLPVPETAEWDPKPEGRTLVRHGMTGDLGYLVRRGGKTVVRLDRANQEILRPYQESLWVREAVARPLNRIHVARLAFEADKGLCAILGMHNKSRKNWLELKDQERAEWIESGPRGPQPRVDLYRSIIGGMKRHTQ